MRTLLYILAVILGVIVIAIATAFLPIPPAAQTGLSFLLAMPIGAFAMVRWLEGRE